MQTADWLGRIRGQTLLRAELSRLAVQGRLAALAGFSGEDRVLRAAAYGRADQEIADGLAEGRRCYLEPGVNFCSAQNKYYGFLYHEGGGPCWTSSYIKYVGLAKEGQRWRVSASRAFSTRAELTAYFLGARQFVTNTGQVELPAPL